MLIPLAPIDADVPVGGVVMVQLGRRLVADVEGRQLLDGVEGQEAEGGRRPWPSSRLPPR